PAESSGSIQVARYQGRRWCAQHSVAVLNAAGGELYLVNCKWRRKAGGKSAFLGRFFGSFLESGAGRGVEVVVVAPNEVVPDVARIIGAHVRERSAIVGAVEADAIESEFVAIGSVSEWP